MRINSEIKRRIGKLKELAAGLDRNLTRASKEFDTVNFSEAASRVSFVHNRLRAAYEEAERLERYLRKLEKSAEEYLHCTFDL